MNTANIYICRKENRVLSNLGICSLDFQKGGLKHYNRNNDLLANIIGGNLYG